MEMSYSSRGIYNFLDVNMGNRQTVETDGLMYKVRMLEKNQISYLISPYENEVDGCFYLRYNTGSSYVLERLFQKIKPDGKFLRQTMTQLFECIRSSGGYLLNPDDIVVNPAYMFYDCGHEKLRLICAPGYDKSITGQVKDFLEYIMRGFDHRDQEGVRYLYELYDDVTNEGFCISNYVVDKDVEIKSEDEYALMVCPKQEVICETEDEAVKSFRLVSLSNGSLKPLIISENVSEISVGRGKRENAYRISGSQISRVHAKIYRRNSGLYLRDAGSTNGTFVNAVRLGEDEEIRLNRGDVVAFATEEFFVS